MAEKTISEKKQKTTSNGSGKDGLKYDFLKETEKNHGLTNEEMIHAYRSILSSVILVNNIDL